MVVATHLLHEAKVRLELSCNIDLSSKRGFNSILFIMSRNEIIIEMARQYAR